jgi:cathepsin X
VFPDIQLSPQVLVNCVTANQTQGCQGGDPTAGTPPRSFLSLSERVVVLLAPAHTAYSWIAANGITDDTCMNYVSGHKCDQYVF